MNVQRGAAPKDADAYVAGLAGWQRALVVSLRKSVLSVGGLEEQIKWGHIVYEHGGPLLLIRAEAERVLFGFWRGRMLVDLDARLKPSGKYDMATMHLVEGDSVARATVRRLVREAVALNDRDGDPRRLPSAR